VHRQLFGLLVQDLVVINRLAARYVESKVQWMRHRLNNAQVPGMCILVPVLMDAIDRGEDTLLIMRVVRVSAAGLVIGREVGAVGPNHHQKEA
jgi:hypothetical protein